MQNNSENEVALKNVSGRITGFFNAVFTKIFSILQLYIHYKWISLSLIFLGVIAGILYKKNSKISYKNELYVAANYNSNEYLYNTIKNYRTLITNAQSPQDSLMLSKIENIKVEPVVDAYQFLLSNYHNLQVFKIISERGIDVEKYLKSKVAEKNYRYHKISFVSKGTKDSTQIIINYFLDKLNQTPYFNARKSFEKQNIRYKREQLQKSVDQLNLIFENMGNTENISGVNLNDYSNMEELFMSKEYLLNQINLLDVENLENEKIIYNVFQNINKKNEFIVPLYIVFPLAFLWLFGLIVKMRNKYFQLIKNK